jgi:hypothetical protein
MPIRVIDNEQLAVHCFSFFSTSMGRVIFLAQGVWENSHKAMLGEWKRLVT